MRLRPGPIFRAYLHHDFDLSQCQSFYVNSGFCAKMRSDGKEWDIEYAHIHRHQAPLWRFASVVQGTSEMKGSQAVQMT